MFLSAPPNAFAAQRLVDFVKPFFWNRVEPDHSGSHVMRLQATAIAALALSYASVLHAAVTQNDLNKVSVELPAHATLPPNLPLQGEDGSTKPLQLWLGTKPSVWVLADYTCETPCGPVISIVSDALTGSGLRPGADFRLVVVGLDPKDTATDAARMRQAQIGPDSDDPTATYFLRDDANAIETLTRVSACWGLVTR